MSRGDTPAKDRRMESPWRPDRAARPGRPNATDRAGAAVATRERPRVFRVFLFAGGKTGLVGDLTEGPAFRPGPPTPTGADVPGPRSPVGARIQRKVPFLAPSPLVGEDWGGRNSPCGIGVEPPPTLTLPHKGGGDLRGRTTPKPAPMPRSPGSALRAPSPPGPPTTPEKTPRSRHISAGAGNALCRSYFFPSPAGGGREERAAIRTLPAACPVIGMRGRRRVATDIDAMRPGIAVAR